MASPPFDGVQAHRSRRELDKPKQMWREAIRAHRAGEPGIPAREAIRSVAEELGLWRDMTATPES